MLNPFQAKFLRFYVELMEKSIIKLKDLYTYIPSVDISDNGVYKYILIQGIWADDSMDPLDKVLFVRGYKHCSYHADIYDAFVLEFKKSLVSKNVIIPENSKIKKDIREAISFECIGGGRINHESKC